MSRQFGCSTLVIAWVLSASVCLHGQASRTWVSGVGDDANPCSRTAPCKTFAGAISKTAAGGEIDVLDPGGFGALTITKGITIDGGGGFVASTLVAGTNGIVVSAGPNDVVVIRNLSINGISGSGNGGLSGIRFIGGAVLHVEKCSIFGFLNHGIDVAQTQNSEVFVKDSYIRSLAGDGLRATTTSGQVLVTVDHTRFEDTNNGLHATTHSRIIARDATLVHAGTTALLADSGDAEISLQEGIVSFNGTAVDSEPGTAVYIGTSRIAYNSRGIVAPAGGNAVSLGGNILHSNGPSAAFTATISPQ